jgi:AcrR family transcriptional regulator
MMSTTTSNVKLSPVADRAYHHGNLRPVLLAEAQRMLREHGIDQLSLRELARQADVSHAAPRRHFADRQALLDALAEAGFTRLADEVCNAIDSAGEDYLAQLRAAANAYVQFAIHDAALLDLMFATKIDRRHEELPDGAVRLFTAVGAVISQGQRVHVLPRGDPERLRLLLVATLHGIAALITSGRAPIDQTDALTTDAVALFTCNAP